MPHHTPLIATLVGGLVLAFILGALAHRMRVSPIVGYLLAGVLVGPFTPGFVADPALAGDLAEIGVILLMFGVGLHFSLKDLLSVRGIAVPGALAQIAFATALGMGLAWSLGWKLGAGLVFGLALSVASTVVLLRALQERRLVETEQGRIAVGWLIVEDLAMVLTLVLLPPIAGLLGGTGETANASDAGEIATALGITFAKVAAFVALMLVIGRQVIPRTLHYVAHTGSRELFRLAVLSLALGVAYGAVELFGVSFALGAFFAGMVLAESELSHRAAEESLPLRDAFAVLFFVSVGMLFDPTILVLEPVPLIATLLIVVLGTSWGRTKSRGGWRSACSASEQPHLSPTASRSQNDRMAGWSGRRVSLGQKSDLGGGRSPPKDFVAVRKAPEALDDLDVGAPVTTQRTAAIGISRQGFGKCQRAPLVSEIFAVMEWHIEEQPPGRRDHLVEPAFERPVRRSACRRIGRVGAGRPAKDVARHLVE
jgi:monovalent cation:proton antiporter-2 (CPA2) family protein